ncbi:MAG: translation initiation factor IF-2 [Tannerella sp.]|uniref:translation initiation factor IF-2 n=1 Tax=Tannerella sp. TaxID=2382127 RepID=UPI003FA29A77
MPVKLNKVLKDLNVGLQTVVDFLHAKGCEIESNPNVRIQDDQYALLVKEFGKNLSEAERRRLLEKAAPKAPIVKESSQKEKEKKEEKPKKEPEVIKTEIPDEIKPKFVTKGKIDLSGIGEPKKEGTKRTKKEEKEEGAPSVAPVEETKKVEEVQQPEPIQAPEPEVVPPPSAPSVEVQEVSTPEPHSAEEPVESKKEEPAVTTQAEEKTVEALPEQRESESAPKQEEEIFRLGQPKLESTIKVTGKIDLASLNQSMRPKKKSKEERRKEREEKRKQQTPADNKQKSGTGSVNAANAASTTGESGKKKRKRIKKDKIDINATVGTNTRRDDHGRGHDHGGKRLKKPVRAEISEEAVQKQVKETLARLTSKGGKSKGAKYRREKRDAVAHREQELQLEEARESKVLKLTEFVTANDLANMMDISVSEVISTCMSIGMMVSINQRLDAETINIVAEEFGFKTEYVSAEVSEAIKEEEDNPEDWEPRPPIVTVMGHVDHGKTSLLDNIRNANVIAGEAGGITQHIGAYNVKLSDGRHITFLDTPGHEAFTAMRARGAKVTDIAIIIVAADDSVMPQTVEAINHASAAGVPIVFAINKVDKPAANPDKIKEQLSQMNYLVEDWGGKYQSQEISAKKGIGVQELLEKVLLEADLLELKANPKKRATASVIESSLDKGRGYVATVLVSNGTLRQGDVILAGTHYGRLKAMFNERNQRVESAGPSEPVLILGLDGAPQAGDTLNVLETEQEAREIAGRREQLQRELGLRTQKRFGLEELGRRRALGDFHELNLIVKGDVDGSVEALSDSLINLSTEEIQVNVIHKAVGQISESDVELSVSSDAIIIGFQVRPAASARKLADKEGVEIRLYSIIYDAIEEVKSAMEGMLSPEIKEEICGNVEVQQVFKISKVGTVAGCIVKEGKIKRTNKVRVIRDGIVIHTGELSSLKRFKDEVKEVVTGQECGIFVNNYNDVQVGDMIEPFDEIEIKKTL